ncbi:DUF1893 domain-containing protein [Lachnospiraceae bacterium LCP25S3_G4]
MKKRLEQAAKILKEQNVSCVILKEGHLPYLSNEIGIKPLMVELQSDKYAFRDAIIADKVVGKAAALMAILGGAMAIYGEVMSEEAIAVLESHHIIYGYGTKVSYIENRRKTDRCPLENAVMHIDDPQIAFDVLEQTIRRLMQPIQ